MQQRQWEQVQWEKVNAIFRWGTSGTIFISSEHFGVDEYNALHSFAHADGHYHLMGCMLSAASCNKWWNEEILKTKDYSAEQTGITKLGENHVYFLPYLMGERSPHNNPDARAMFIGMSMDTTREEMTQAVLEGVAFGLRDSLEVARSLGISPERTKICGGGAKSPLWRQIIANVMNLKVDVLENEEGRHSEVLCWRLWDAENIRMWRLQQQRLSRWWTQ